MSIISHVSIEFLRIMSNIYVSQVATIHRYHQKVMTMILFDDTEKATKYFGTYHTKFNEYIYKYFITIYR